MANLYTVLSERFLVNPSRIALKTPDNTWTYQQLHDLVGKMANWLDALALTPGARVAAQVEKTPQALALYLATVRSGFVYLPLNTAYRESEIAYFLDNAKPAVFVCDTNHLVWAQPLSTQSGVAHTLTLDANGQGSLMRDIESFESDYSDANSRDDDLAAILYTSGTTGRSKGAMLTHRNLLSNTQTLNGYWGWHSDDVLLHMLPIFHIHGLFVACHGALYAGAQMVWLPKLDVNAALKYLPDCTIMMGVPTYYVRLLAERAFDRSLTQKMRLFVSGSAPLLIDTFQEFEQRMGQAILERYGMSETGMLTSNPYQTENEQRIGSTVGRPLPGIEVRVVDDNQNTCAPDVVGHIQVKGPNVFLGYWEMPEKTREEFTADGWFKTGDLGRWGGKTAQGQAIPVHYLSIVGRSKDLIISGGFNVYPKEIETIIDDMAGVLESAVIGLPHADFGEAVVAVVVAKPGAGIDTEQLREQLKRALANYKIPKEIHLVEELPRNAMGKVQKNLLREQFSH
jgi:malonyl-CoA/methylmalonyl-CoA synthetase|uniref:malonate--CoA ligase n=2 Tax=Orrella sp. TaxID=1921583 RepID=UPI004048D3F4